MGKKIILHLCADTGSDTWPFQHDPDYVVIKVGIDIGVENFHAPKNVYGVYANPPRTEFSTLRRHPKLRASRPEDGMILVRECQRIIEEANPVWWAIENPATGRLKDYLGKPRFTYQPWQFGSPLGQSGFGAGVHLPFLRFLGIQFFTLPPLAITCTSGVS